MDDKDRELLSIAQSDFPITTRPFQTLGEKLGISEEEALARVRRLSDEGIIRRLGPSFDSRKLGYRSLLVAAKVAPERLSEVADVVSEYPQVTHNYGREHRYNLWFTLICRDDEEIDRVLGEIEARTGISDMHRLPAERMFKIRVEFNF